MALSFATDIRPLFRDLHDVEAMKRFGVDLSSRDDVKPHAETIYTCFRDGGLPSDTPWPSEQVGRFRQWMGEGMNP